MSDGYINIGTKIDEGGIDAGLKRVKSLLDDAAKYYATFGKEGESAFKKISEQLKAVDASASISGDKIGALAEKKKILKTAIESLISQGLTPEDLKVKSLQKAYDELTSIQVKNSKQTEKSGKSIKDTFADIRDFMQGPVAAAKLTTDAIKKAISVVKDLTSAYKTQIKAETQLEAAARNNPFLDNNSVQALKNYASEIQSHSTYGDEELIPMMAKLAAAGRTQDEIMQVMAAATDMAASGAFTLESAVNNLNKSYGGLSGELGESIPEIKALTAEQLKNGEAVKLLAGRYKGISEQVAKTTGTADQLKNAFGDLKEELGAPFEKALAPVRSFFTEIVTGWTNAKKAKREFEEGREEVQAGRGSLDQIAGQVMAAESEVERFKKLLSPEEIAKSTSHMSDAMASSHLSNLEAQLREANALVTKYTIQFSKEQQRLKEEEASKKKTDDELALAEAERKRNEDAADHIAKVTAQREKDIEAIDLQAQAEGKQADALEILNAYTSSYVSLITESNGLITASNPIAQELLDTIQKRSQAIQKEIDAEEKLNAQIKANEEEKERIAELAEKNRQKLEDSVKSILDEAMSEKEVIAQEMELIELQYAQLTTDEQLKIQEDYNRAYELLKEKEVQINKDAEEQKRTQSIQSAQKILSTANDFATQYMNIQKTITDMATQAVEAETAIKSLELEKQYASGAVSLEEYEKKKLEIEKESAQKKYKLDMWEWTSSVLSATSSTALAVVKALESGPILGPIMAGLIGAAGAAQLVSIMASKPQPPAFATGGIVGGNSYTGDNVVARVNSGEMILNPTQQRNLFDSINRGNMNGANVQVYNSAANDVKVKPEITEKGIKIMIDKTVASTMGKGGYNDSMKAAQGSMRGKRITQ